MRSSSFIGQHLAAESIDFQSPAFFKELTLAFEALKGVKRAEVQDSEQAAAVSAIVQHHTGLDVTFQFGDYDPCVEIPAVNKNNILVNQWRRDFVSSSDGMKLIAEADGAARGTVSLKTGKVSGMFTQIKNTIHLPVEMLSGSKYTPEEIAAITLHEVGHLLTYFEFITRTVTTNQVLAGISKALDGSGSVEQREAVLISAKKALKLSDLDTKQLAKSSNNKIVEVVVVTNTIKASESELGSNVYDLNSWEMLADQYVTRFGAGRQLITALEKIYGGEWNMSFRSTPAFLAYEAIKLLLLFSGIFTLTGLLLILLDGAGSGDYDKPGARMKRVRNQIVENLKKPKLSPADRERLNADLVALDDILAQVEDRRQLLGVIWDAVSPASRRAYNQEKLQRELEDLATNDLFVKAAQLKQLA